MVAAQAGAEGFELLGIAARHGEPGALCGQRPGDRGADAAGSAGDECGHACEVEHHWIP
jgi:hypothetical protein